LTALLSQMERLATREPVLVVYEDVHWVDPTTLELLSLMIDRVQHLAALLLVTARPEFRPPWPAYAHVTTITLGRIGRDDGASLVGQVTGGKKLPVEVLQQILARTDGVPLFIEELTKTVIESGMLADAGNRYTVAGPLPPLAIPTSLNASLLARLDRLAPAREVAQVGAALGRSFSYELISAIAAMPQQQLDEALAQLVRAELIFQRGVPPNAEYTFKHALVQDAAYSTLLHSRRQQFHARIAAAIEDRFPEIVAAQPARVAQHCVEAGLSESAIKYWTAAGDSAELRGMVHEAVAHYRAAIKLFSTASPVAVRAHEPELLMKLGSALQQAEGYSSQAALQAYQHARTVALASDQLENYAKAGIGLAPLLFGDCRYQEVLKILGKISENSLDCLGPQTRVHLLTMLSVANFGIGEYQKAWDQAVAACTLDDEVTCTHRNPIGGGDPAVVARTYATRVGLVLGHFERCLALGEQALAIARERNHAFSVAWALLCFGRTLCTLGRFTEALTLGTEAIGLCERHGFHARMGTVLIFTGSAYVGLGDAERGLAEIRRGLKLWREASGRFHASWWLSEFADCLMRAEKFDQVDAVLCEAEQVVAATDERSFVAELIRLRGLLLTQRGQLTHGTAQLLRAVEWSQSRSAKLFELRAIRDLARIQMSQGQSGRAFEKLRAVISSFPSALETPDLKEANALLDRLT
jgi:tetratricopeptide (TPR) repeat protein